MSEYYDWADEHRSELMDALETAGASEELRTIADTQVRGVRHSVLEELHKWSDGEPTVDAAKKAARLGGGFFTTLWDGHLFEAFCQADSNNKKIIADAYEPTEIIDSGSRYDRAYRETLVQERWPVQTA